MSMCLSSRTTSTADRDESIISTQVARLYYQPMQNSTHSHSVLLFHIKAYFCECAQFTLHPPLAFPAPAHRTAPLTRLFSPLCSSSAHTPSIQCFKCESCHYDSILLLTGSIIAILLHNLATSVHYL